MAERVVSPGVFTRERDLSFLEQGEANIGAAFVGVTQKGPAFVPVIVDSQTEFENRFGKADEYSYLGYTVQNYLQEAQSSTVVRVLGLGGYKAANNLVGQINVSGSGGFRTLAVFHPTISGSSITSASATLTNLTSMTIHLSGSGGITSSYSGVNVSASNASSVRNTIGTNPYSPEAAYVYSYFPEAIDPLRGGVTAGASGHLIVSASTALEFDSVDYTNASTPWIRTQQIGGSRSNCFKVHTLADGSNANKAVKISIQSIRPQVQSGSFGTFSMLVRAGDDTDAKTEILEEYHNLTLDPDSSDYVARRVGNSAPFNDTITNETYYQGEYTNTSRYVRVEMAPAAAALPEVAVPYGFAALSTPYVVGTSSSAVPPTIIDTAWTTTADGAGAGYSTTSSRDVKKFYGYDYSETNFTNQSYLAPTPTGATSVNYVPLPNGNAAQSTQTEFSLDNTRASEVDGTTLSLDTAGHVTYRKFTVPMQGGFDGYAPHTVRKMGAAITSANTQGFDLSNSAASGSVAYKKAIDAIKNPESFDINLLAIPGVNYEQHSYIAQYAIDVCEDRQDCFYILDLASYGATIATANTTAGTIDTNYAAGWYPWVKVINTNTNKFMWAPPSVVLPEVFAYNDNAAAEWFAPAGLNRGGIPGATQAKSRLSRANRDELYENKVNPIATFPGQGIVAWGQKTLQKKASALDRINVRRLLIALKKFVASSSRYLVFEQNTEATRNRFLNIVNPYLASVQERQGLYAFRVIMDETNNTPDVIDRNQLVGQIYLQPARAAEFIVLDFNIMPTGATFPGS